MIMNNNSNIFNILIESNIPFAVCCANNHLKKDEETVYTPDYFVILLKKDSMLLTGIRGRKQNDKHNICEFNMNKKDVKLFLKLLHQQTFVMVKNSSDGMAYELSDKSLSFLDYHKNNTKITKIKN